MIRRTLRLFALQFRISAASAMAYRANFLIEGALSAVWTVINLVPFVVVFHQRSELAPGWDQPAALIVMAYFMGVHAIIQGTISPSMEELVGQIRTGAFDYVLLKPVDAQIMVAASRYEPWKIFDLAAAIAVIVYAFVQRGAPPSALRLALGIAMFGAGVAATYALWMVCAAASFWVVRLDNLMFLLGSIFDVARWPVDVFRGVWRIVFTFVIPVAVMTTFPAMTLLGTLAPWKMLATAAGALALLALSRIVWRTAIRSYTSASS
jgi:ABC-2 type transport system permease protein